MEIKLKLSNSTTRSASLPYEGAEFVVATGTCPACSVTPFRVRGGDPVRGHDRVIAPAGCVDCGAVVGTVGVTFSTIFGIEEDERVLNGRCRVY